MPSEQMGTYSEDREMFQNYFLVALRNLFKHKLYSLINIGGLAIGLAAVILITLFVRYETSYDEHWDNADKVYRADITFNVPGRAPMQMAQTPGPLAPTMAREMQGAIKASSRLFRDCFEISHEENKFNECADYVDANFFELFNFDVVAGNADLALANNTSIMIAESVALKYFGQDDVIGQTLIMNKIPYTVVAVMKNLPPNSHINSDMIGLFDPLRYLDQPWRAEQWTSANTHAYFMLEEGVSIDEVTKNIPEFLDKNVNFKLPGLENMKASELMSFGFSKLSDIHLEATMQGNMVPPGNAALVYTFIGVAALVLLIATINFMNLSTARATQRAREVSIRKVMGATRGQLIAQFLGEALLMTLFGLLLAVILVELLLPSYNMFLGKELIFSLTTDVSLLFSMIGLALMIGLLGGLYPAFVLSNFRPALVLHSNKSSAGGSVMFRNILVLAQFAITIGLMIVTGVMYGQTVYATNMDKGYESDNRVVIRGIYGEGLKQKMTAIRQELLNVPGIEAVSFASDTMPLQNDNNTLVEAPGGALGGRVLIEQLRVAYDYFDFYGIKPVAGRVFSKDFSSDEYIDPPEVGEGEKRLSPPLNIVINEKAVGQLGFASPEEALNKQVKTMYGPDEGSDAMATIIGVVPNVMFRSAREEVTPILFVRHSAAFSAVHVKLSAGNSQDIVKRLDPVWKEISGQPDLSLRFVEENIDRLYRSEREQAGMFVFFSIFAIFVACLGLFGMANFTAERRTKEIGIRKVLGASVFDIVRLLIVQASKPVLLANLIAWPVAGYFMHDWLQGFPIRLEMPAMFMVFVAAGASAIFIAWVTISVHAFRAARSNPIQAIRVE